MNTGIEILLKRMETHPEEFYYKPNEGVGKWTRLLDTFKRSLTQEEVDAIDEGLRKIERERFTELVMQTLAGVDDKTSEERKLPSTVTLSGTTTGTWGSRTAIDASALLDAQRYQTEQMRIQLDAQREVMKKYEELEVNKKPLIKRIFK